jgi:hypothetical protein
MSGSSGAGFAIAISGQDAGVQAMLSRLTGSIDKLTGHMQGVSKGNDKLGDTSGITRLTGSMHTFGGETLNAFRSMERLVPSMGALTGAASIGGMAALIRSWADLSNRVTQTAYRLSIPVDQLSGLEFAARRAGSSAESLDSGMKTLQEQLYGAAWGRDPGAVAALKSVDIDPGTPGHVLDTADALGQLADKLKGMNPHQQVRALQLLGIPEDLLPMLRQGRKQIEQDVAKAHKLGGVITPDMAKDANELRKSYEDLSEAIGGVGNRLADTTSKYVGPWMEMASKWIGKNQELSTSIAGIGIGLALLKPAGWVLRMLGLGAAGAAVVPAVGGVITHEALDAVDPTDKTGAWVDRNIPGASWLDDLASRYLGLGRSYKQQGAGGSGGGGGGGAISVPHGPSRAAATMQEAHDFFRAKGLTEQQTAGILSNISAESAFDPSRWGDNHSSYGLFQDHLDRLAGKQKQYGATPSVHQQLEYAWSELNTSKKSVLDAMNRNPRNAALAGDIFGSGFEVPAGGASEAWRRGQASPQFVQGGDDAAGPVPYAKPGDTLPGDFPAAASGHVHVEVTLNGKTDGATAKTTTTGKVTAAPARIMQPMTN